MFKSIGFLAANVLVILGLSSVLSTFEVDNLLSAFLFIFVLTLINWFIIPVIEIISLPVSFLTFGLFSLLINLFGFWLATRIPGINLTGSFWEQFLTLILIAGCLTITQTWVHKLLEPKK